MNPDLAASLTIRENGWQSQCKAVVDPLSQIASEFLE